MPLPEICHTLGVVCPHGFGDAVRPRRNPGDLDNAVKQLLHLGTDAENIASTAAVNIRELQNLYLQWVSRAETQLRHLFADDGAWLDLYTDRFRLIHGMTQAMPRPFELINTEARVQANRIEGLRASLTELAEWLASGPGLLTVIDTNVILHYLPPEQVDWVSVTGARRVRLVMPPRVIDELDEKKYTARDDLADRSRRILSQLRARLAGVPGTPVVLRDDVTIEVPTDLSRGQHTLDADEEIIRFTLEIVGTKTPACLVTGDSGTILRAQAAGLTVREMPEDYLRRKPKSEEVA